MQTRITPPRITAPPITAPRAVATLAAFALAACSAAAEDMPPAPDAEREQPEEVSSALLDGFDVTAEDERQNPEFRSVVRIALPPENLPSPRTEGSCSGIKVGPAQFLTAAHCFVFIGDDDRVGISNRRDGALSGRGGYTQLRVGHRYIPDDYNFWSGYNDLAVLEVKDPTPDIPVMSAPRIESRWISPEQWGRLVSYGNCEDQAPYDKRWADFQAYSHGLSADPNMDEYAIVSFTEQGTLCNGDSGGPLLQNRGGKWQVIGVHFANDTQTGATVFTRVDRYVDFIESTRNACRNRCIDSHTAGLSGYVRLDGVQEAIAECIEDNCVL